MRVGRRPEDLAAAVVVLWPGRRKRVRPCLVDN